MTVLYFIKTVSLRCAARHVLLKRGAVFPELHQCVTVGQCVSASTNHEGDKTGAMGAGTDALANRSQFVNRAAAGGEI